MTVNYGEDFVSDLDANLTTVSGSLALLHAIRNRLRCRRGALVGFPDYGLDLRAFVGSTVPDDVIGQQAQAQVELDERVYSASVTITRERLAAHSSERLVVSVHVVGDEGPFDFTLLVSELTVDILDSI